MVSSLYRFMFVFLGFSPVSIGLFCAGAKNFSETMIGLLEGFFVICIAVFFFKQWLRYVRSQINSDAVVCQIQTIAEKRSASSTYFLAYVLPLMLGTEIPKGVVVAIVITFAFVCFVNESEDNNPLARLLRYRFYDVTSPHGQTFLVMSKRTMQELCSRKKEPLDKAPSIFGLQVDSSFVICKE